MLEPERAALCLGIRAGRMAAWRMDRSASPMATPEEEVRMDKFLWAVRLYKTRADATDACRAGHVSVLGHPAKPGRPVHLGEIISALVPPVTRTVKVIGLSGRRVGPKLVGRLIEDQTPASEYLKAEQARPPGAPQREKGLGRPTKKERRELERFFG